jgi:hypothetical protein
MIAAKAEALRGAGRYERPLVVHGHYRVERRDAVERHDRIGGAVGIVKVKLQGPADPGQEELLVAPDDHLKLERPGGIEVVGSSIGGGRDEQKDAIHIPYDAESARAWPFAGLF